jgi:hypothetical protein
MVLLSRPWNLFNSNSFPNFKLLNVATNTSKSSYWNPVGPLNHAPQTNFDATSKTIKELFETVTAKLISLFNSPTTWIFTGFGLFLLFYPNGKLIVLDAISWIPRTIAYSRIYESTAGNNYVERKDLEDQLEAAFTCTPIGHYYIVYGDKGVGKTELVTHAAIYNKNKKPSFYDKLNNLFLWNTDSAYRYGVIKIKVHPGQQYSDVFANLLSRLYLPFALLNIDLLEFHMKSVHWWWPSMYPTIIFDVERGKVEEQKTPSINAVRSLAKDLAHTCRCIIVLSEANAVLDAGDDRHREEFIFVDEFSIEEAKTFLKKRNCIVPDVELSASDFAAYKLLKDEKLKSQVETEKENFDASTSQVETKGEEESKSENTTTIVNGMDYLFYNIGTSPASLVSFVDKISKGMAVTTFVNLQIEDAKKCLEAFPLPTILQALKDHHPEGVRPGYFKKLKEEGIALASPESVGQIMKKKLNPLIYRQELNLYQLLSTSHKTALRTYDPLPIPS